MDGCCNVCAIQGFGWTLSLFKDKPEKKEGKIDPFHLTLDEAKVADALSKRILVTIDKKQGLQLWRLLCRTLISASLTDTVMHCLQNYITNYRTNKAPS